MRTLYSQLSFADVQLQRIGVQPDPALQAISAFLDQHLELINLVHRDLQRGMKNPHTGRNGIGPSQVLRSLVLMRVKNWDYRELRERIEDGISLRGFTHFDCQPVPKHDAFNRAFNRITPQTMEALNRSVIQAAVDLGLEDGKKLRVDTTVVETDIHYPTDATLLWDSVRMLTRLVKDLDEKMPNGVSGFPDRTRCARRRMQEIQRMTAQQRSQQQLPKYRQLIRITQQVVDNTSRVTRKVTKTLRRKNICLSVTDRAKVDQLLKQIDHYSQLAERVIDQTRRRVLENETVPSQEKVYSIFEPHTDLIKRGKAQKPVEFGHKVFLAESAQGLITGYRVLDGNPADSDQVAESVERHKQTFDRVPDVYAADRGFHSAGNVEDLRQAKVLEISIPQRGGTKTEEQDKLEKSGAFKKNQRFRAGIEGRISVLFRGRGMKRCRAKGRQRFEILVGAAVLVNNLLRIASLLGDNKKQKVAVKQRAAA